MRGIEHRIQYVDEIAEPFDVLAFGPELTPHRETKNTYTDLCIDLFPHFFKKAAYCIDPGSFHLG
jgi:hypothetical protein